MSILISMIMLGHSAYGLADLESLDVGDAADNPGSTEILADGTINVIGAGGPMGMMHAIRNICQLENRAYHLHGLRLYQYRN